MDKKKVISILALPILVLVLYFGLKTGYISPMVKAIDIQIIGGTFITNINKYVIKVDDEVNISPGKYIVVPSFAKKPELKFVILDNEDVLSIKGNRIKAKKPGYATIGIMTKNRVLRKATVMVVNPVINNLEMELDTNIKYFGDRSKITSSVDINEYKSLEKGYKIKYSTSDEKILKVSGDYVEAVGVGQAKLIASYNRKEIQRTLNVLPRVDKLSVENYYVVEKGKRIKLNPSIKTSPSGSTTKIEYRPLNEVDQSKFDTNKRVINGDAGVETQYGISIDNNGNIKGNLVGTYSVDINAGNKKANTTIEVTPQKFRNIVIENLHYRIDEESNLFSAEIGWDYNKDISYYRVYVKKDEEDFTLFTTIRANRRNLPSGNRVSTYLNLVDGNKFEIKVVGYNGSEETKASNVVSFSKTTNLDFQHKKVSGLDYKLDAENKLINLKWKPIDKGKYTYRVYYINKKFKEKRYILMAKNIDKPSVILRIEPDVIDYEFYVVAINERGQISDFSKALNIYSLLSE